METDDRPNGSDRRAPGAEPGTRAVTLDLWHTLVYLEPDQEEGYMREQLDLAVETLRRSPRRAGVADTGADGFADAFREAYVGAVRAAEEGRTVTPAQQIARAAERCGRTVDEPSYLDQLTALVARTGFRPAPSVDRMLRTLRSSGYRTAVISNTVGEPGAALRPILSSLGIDQHLDDLVFSDEQPWTKPAAEIFDYAMQRIGAVRQRTVHVGDGWSDIEGARRAGLQGGILYTGLRRYGELYGKLFLSQGWREPPSEYRTDRLEEVPPMVDRLLGA